MKTSNNRGLPSSNRYKMAALKRFTNFMFWGPPLILGSVLFVVWQYQQHPEWLSGVQGEGQTLPQSEQFEEPGIYNELPTDISSPNLNNFDNIPNQPFTQPPSQPLPPSANTIPNLNPLPPSDNSANSSEQEQGKPGTTLPNLFPPLFPVNKNQNTSRPSYTPSSSPIKIDVNRESELQKAVRQRSSQSSSVQNNAPQTGQSSFNQTPSTSANPTNPNNSITPRNGQNYQTPYVPQPTVPQYTYSPNPPATYNNPTQQPNNYNYSQPYTPPSYGNNRQNVGNPTQIPTINGRPAPQFQPSIQGDRGRYD